MAKLFGTDGIRGVANRWPLSPEFITRIGASIGSVLRQHPFREGYHPSGFALIGRDTRLSGGMIENALAAGLLSQGLSTLHVGILTTPGIAYLTRALGASCGISISASHNPYEDNGIKVFGSDGFKIPDVLEDEVEALAQSAANAESEVSPADLGRRRDYPHAVDAYTDFLLDAVGRRLLLQGQRIVVDCNHGATFELAPQVLTELGAEVIALNVDPDGVNINQGYDALEPKWLRETVLLTDAHWGVQFDGDGDRAVFVNHDGAYFDGDFVLAILARDLAERNQLQVPVVVSTVMANIGLEKALAEMGLGLERTPVGDRWVTERMRTLSAQIGGEQSGHVVFLDGGHTTGDGLYTTLRLAEVMTRRGADMAALAQGMRKYPQVLVNVRVPRKPPLEDLPEIQARVAQSQQALGNGSRIVLRYSGTENLARVMIEGDDFDRITREANAIADTIRRTIP